MDYKALHNFVGVMPNGAGCFAQGAEALALPEDGMLAAAFRTQLRKYRPDVHGIERDEAMCTAYMRLRTSLKAAMKKFSSPRVNKEIDLITDDPIMINSLVRTLILGYVNRDLGIMEIEEKDVAYGYLRGQQKLYGLASGSLHPIVLVLALSWEIGRFIPSALGMMKPESDTASRLSTHDTPAMDVTAARRAMVNGRTCFEFSADTVEHFLRGDMTCVNALQIIWGRCTEEVSFW